MYDIKRMRSRFLLGSGAAVICASAVAMLGSSPAKPVPAKPTFALDIAPLLYRHCAACHRPGEAAPFSLLSYEDAKKRADTIAYMVEKRIMPPWKAVKGYGSFHDENYLTDEQIKAIGEWAKAGAPRGPIEREPKPPKFGSEWALGAPDLVLQPKRSFKLPAEGEDVYRHFIIDPGNKESLFVTAMDVKPGNRKIVHHVIAFLDSRGQAEKVQARRQDDQEGYNSFGSPGFIPQGALGGWAPGLQARHLPDGAAFEVKPGTKVILQVHYHPSGKEESDQTRVGLYLSKKPVTKEVQLAWMANPMFRLKAGDADSKVNLQFPVPVAVTLYGVMPHMHLLGKEMKAWAVLPDKKEIPLVWVRDWDFNWQFTYAFKEPIKLPAGSRIHISGTYDNSDGNPRNPNRPPKDVRWGEQTTDEMFLLVGLFALGS
ncbi:MAG: hypothetical protein HONBIEJF_03034 [Fimbriimonadaceae bacterium]|nr:hypothetical protein [Fimbriimonadaceae bacterium]